LISQFESLSRIRRLLYKLRVENLRYGAKVTPMSLVPLQMHQVLAVAKADGLTSRFSCFGPLAFIAFEAGLRGAIMKCACHWKFVFV
jgi:hypothetical protein